MDIKRTETARGFMHLAFKDHYDIACSIQESSLATEAAIWLGCDDANPRHCVPDKGWQPVAMPEGTVTNTRMHLTQEQVKALLPALIHFAECGELPKD